MGPNPQKPQNLGPAKISFHIDLILQEKKAQVDALQDMFSKQIKMSIQREKFISERINDLKTLNEKTKNQAEEIKSKQKEISSLNQEISSHEQQMDVIKDVLFKQEKVFSSGKQKGSPNVVTTFN